MGKIINMYEYQKDKEAIKEVIIENFFEVEENEEEQEQTQDGITISLLTKEDVDELLSSNIPYKEKLEILRNERAKATSLATYMDDAESDFCNSNYYLNQMRKNKRDLAKNIRTGLITSLSSAAVGATGIGVSAAYLAHNTFADMNFGQFGAFVIFSIGIPVLSIVSGAYVADDIANYKQLDKEIKNYKRMLKK